MIILIEILQMLITQIAIILSSRVISSIIRENQRLHLMDRSIFTMERNLASFPHCIFVFLFSTFHQVFLFYRFKSSVWHPYVYSHGDTGVRFDRVSIKDDVFFDMPIYTPTQNEQEKIATLLSLIDERIATQNKIIEDLKKLKSAIIEKYLMNPIPIRYVWVILAHIFVD